VAGSPARYQYVNIASAYTQGVEASVRLGPVRDLFLDLGYTLTDSQDKEKHRRLEGRALHTGTFLIGFYRARWGLEATVRGAVIGPRRYYTDHDDGTYETNRVPSYVQLEARVAETLPMWRHLTFFVGAQNLLSTGDAQYTPLPPRTFYGGVAARY
jgi:outer membrane receptor for ferrienterochelin and colicins